MINMLNRTHAENILEKSIKWGEREDLAKESNELSPEEYAEIIEKEIQAIVSLTTEAIMTDYPEKDNLDLL